MPMGLSPAALARIAAVNPDVYACLVALQNYANLCATLQPTQQVVAGVQSVATNQQPSGAGVINENLTPTDSGDHQTFTLPGIPSYFAGSLRLYWNGQRLKGGGTDYTENPGAGGFTLTSALTGSWILLADCRTP